MAQVQTKHISFPSLIPNAGLKKKEEEKANLFAAQESISLNFEGNKPLEKNPLFPNLKAHALSISKETEEPDFERNVWTDSTRQGADPISLSSFSEKAERQAIKNDPSCFSRKVTTYCLAEAIGKSYDLHLILQNNTLKVLRAMHQGIQKIRDEMLAFSKEEMKNRQSFWSTYIPSPIKFLLPYFSYLSIVATGVLGIQALFTGSFLLAGLALVSFFSFVTGKLLSHFTDYKRTSNAFMILGTICSMQMLSSHFITIFTRGCSETFAKTIVIGKFLSEQMVHYYQQKVSISNWRNQAKQVKYQFEKAVTTEKIQQTIRELGDKHATQVIGSATKAIDAENQIKSDMARGKR